MTKELEIMRKSWLIFPILSNKEIIKTHSLIAKIYKTINLQARYTIWTGKNSTKIWKTLTGKAHQICIMIKTDRNIFTNL